MASRTTSKSVGKKASLGTYYTYLDNIRECVVVWAPFCFEVLSVVEDDEDEDEEGDEQEEETNVLLECETLIDEALGSSAQHNVISKHGKLAGTDL